jgi:hypothetical protein
MVGNMQYPLLHLIEGNEENNLESLESSSVSNNFRAFAGKPINEVLLKTSRLYIQTLTMLVQVGREEVAFKSKVENYILLTYPNIARLMYLL